ncbi:Nitric oxide reductase activation protein (plasmid) [Alkalihalophilus pseudofirmus OF4]|uniref:Nitric oxide reductase activation protein n=1 Tax=Alkalihalophilus pseudofirmus (strain ATCC BAA-2126 / JCM 17055 / OF4) TaxID=398511 RepID=D3G1E8_ALKPO|nr:nitric oxide reductase activation protein [Alkalihalophilus pseudofirmus]ADC52174.1 Nitric oxide reductase activation protein [Alkalihalophilus pseudofirmus OF4]
MSIQLIQQERERKRLYRFLRFNFNHQFEMFWSNKGTSYTDGKDIYIQFEMQQPARRPFTEAECKLLRKGHSIHEVGHLAFDQLQDYFKWLKDLTSQKNEDWMQNKGYPHDWVVFFGNMALDGRMENLCILKDPSYAPYIDFNNYEWRFGIRGEQAGECRIKDFREAYGSRVLGLEDIPNWHIETMEVIEDIQPLLELARFSPTTQSCLDYIKEIMEKVWPTILSWYNENGKKPDQESDDSFFTVSHEEPTYQSDDGDQHAQEVLEANGLLTSDGDIDLSNASKRSLNNTKQIVKDLLSKEEKQLTKEQQEDPQFKTERNQLDIPTPEGQQSCDIIVRPLKDSNINHYHYHLQKVKRQIIPFSKTLQKLLEGKKDQVRRNQRSGKFDPSKAWKASKLEQDDVFVKNKKGSPSKGAAIQVIWDQSGSTDMFYGKEMIIDQMKQAAILLAEACQRINLPLSMHGFSTDFLEEACTYVDEIYPLVSFESGLKDYNRSLIGGVHPRRTNHDPAALAWGYEQLKKRKEDIRLLIMISDGLPCFEGNEDTSTMSTLVKQAEKEGIETLCLFIGDHSPVIIDQVREMYPSRSIIAKSGLIKETERHVKRIIRNRL